MGRVRGGSEGATNKNARPSLFRHSCGRHARPRAHSTTDAASPRKDHASPLRVDDDSGGQRVGRTVAAPPIHKHTPTLSPSHPAPRPASWRPPRRSCGCQPPVCGEREGEGRGCERVGTRCQRANRTARGADAPLSLSLTLGRGGPSFLGVMTVCVCVTGGAVGTRCLLPPHSRERKEKRVTDDERFFFLFVWFY